MYPSPPYYSRIAAAYVRGRHIQNPDFALREHLITKPFESLSTRDIWDLCDEARSQAIPLDRYKETHVLPRVKKVLGALAEMYPESLLDIGSGRGAFLWPLLDRFKWLPVTSIDSSPQRSLQLEAVVLGGLLNFSAYQMDATDLQFEDGAFDVMTALEVLEHIPQVGKAVAEVCRVARRFVIASVPSKEDNNPEHIHLLNEPTLRELFAVAGASQITFDYVLNHRIAIVRVAGRPG